MGFCMNRKPLFPATKVGVKRPIDYNHVSQHDGPVAEQLHAYDNSPLLAVYVHIATYDTF